jgi:hypothetical protein
MKNTKQVSKLLGIKESQTRKHAHNLKIKKVGRDYVFMPEDIEKVRSRIGKVGRPSKSK